MKNLYFYTTAGCCLCDQAEEILRSLQDVPPFSCEVVDIADSDELVDQYGIRIPVLQDQQSKKEISWPFSPEQLSRWIFEISNHL